MIDIQVSAKGSSLIAKSSGEITSGMVGIGVNIEYDNQWATLNKTAFFKSGNFVRKREGIGIFTTVPWEVLRKHGNTLEIGLEGRDIDGNIVMPTVWATVTTIRQGAQGEIPAAPNPNSGGNEPTGGADIDDSEISPAKTWSSKKISEEISGCVKSVNGTTPDENGNVTVESDCYVVKVITTATEDGGNVYTAEGFNWAELRAAIKTDKAVCCRLFSLDGRDAKDYFLNMVYDGYFVEFIRPKEILTETIQVYIDGTILVPASSKQVVSKTLLWQNAAPRSNFTEQTINVKSNLGSFQEVEVEFICFPATVAQDLQGYRVTAKVTTQQFSYSNGGDAYYPYGFARNFGYNTTLKSYVRPFCCVRDNTTGVQGVWFGEAFPDGNGSIGFTPAYLIPYRIYGIGGAKLK